jgi:hypothetical protein
MRIVRVLVVALLAASFTGCTGSESAGPRGLTSAEGTPPTAPPAALEGEPLSASAVIFPWDWDWRRERR